jgi:hypothetical protein
MKIKLTRKLIAVVISLVLLALIVPAASAYEGHLVDIRAHVKGQVLTTFTPGYWKNHLPYTTHVFNDFLGGSIDIGWRHVDNIPDLMGIFHADKAKNSDKSHRDELCKERVKASWQALAAILNSSLPNGAPLPVTLTEIQNTLNGIDKDAIIDLGELLDDHNNNPLYHENPIEDCDFMDIMNETCPIKCLEESGLVNIPFADCP